METLSDHMISLRTSSVLSILLGSEAPGVLLCIIYFKAAFIRRYLRKLSGMNL